MYEEFHFGKVLLKQMEMVLEHLTLVTFEWVTPKSIGSSATYLSSKEGIKMLPCKLHYRFCITMQWNTKLIVHTSLLQLAW